MYDRSETPSPVVGEGRNAVAVAIQDPLNDHRNQPDSLPVRTSFSELRRVTTGSASDRSDPPLDASIDRASASRFADAQAQSRSRSRSRSFGSMMRRTRSRASSVAALSDPEDVPSSGGILLNAGQGANIERRRSRKLTRTSTRSITGTGDSDDSSNGSRVSLNDQTEEDVCFPMVKSDERVGVDFVELDAFTDSTKQGSYVHHRYKSMSTVNPDRFMSNHRPLVPQGISLEDRSTPVSQSPQGSQPESEDTQVEPPRQSRPRRPSETFVSSTLYTDPMSVSEKEEIIPENPYQSKEFPVTAEPAGDRFSFFAADMDETVHAPDIPSLVNEGDSFKDLFSEANGTWWLDCMDPTDAEMKVISKAFGIHPLTAEDIRTEESREKVELFRNYYFVCFHTFDNDRESEEFLEPVNMYIVVFRDGILSFHFSSVSHCANVRRRIRQLREYVSVSSDWICYALIDDITDSFAPIIHEIEVETDVIEDSVFVARQSDFGHMLRRIGEARKKVMTLLRLLSGKADVIKMFAKRCNEHWDNAPKGEIGLYLGDIQDHIITMYQNLSAYEKIFSRSHANYLAQLQVVSVTSNNRVTQVLGKATLIGTVLVPMNLVTGLFGMNVRVPGEGGSNVAWFFGIVGFILLMVIILFTLAQRWMGDLSSEDAVDDSGERRSSAMSILSRRSTRERD